MTDFPVGSYVRIVKDEYPELQGLFVRILNFSEDGTCALVESEGIEFWCALSHLEGIDNDRL